MKSIKSSVYNNSDHSGPSCGSCDNELAQARALLDMVEEVCFVLDQDFLITYVNKHTLKSFEKDADELIGHAFHDIFPYTKSILNLASIRQALYENRNVFTDVQSPFSGRSFQVNATGLHDGFLFFMKETTVERRYQELLLEKDARFAAVTNAMSEAIIIVDPGDRIRYASPANNLALGYTTEELEDSKIFDFIAPQQLDSAKTNLRALIEKPEDYADLMVILKHADGSLVEFHAADPAITKCAGVDGIILKRIPQH